MLEESKMDKKTMSRLATSQSRTSANDCKKSSELTNKPWPRNNKKREVPGSAPKNEQYRKNVPAQRGRGPIDRKPRFRGACHLGGTPNTRLEDDEEPEIGSVFVPGSKKQNMNHLLKINCPPRVSERHGPMRQQYRIPYRHKTADLYLRANCQFVVKDGGDCKANLMDPDLSLKWEQIEEVIVRGTGRTECPICIGTLAAGRVGLCGHVYCWACILHYNATHEKQPPPCPVCSAPLHVKDMKPARIVQWASPGETVTMRLVRRLRGSTTVELAPTRGILTDAAEPILPLTNVNVAPYSKFFSASKQQVLDIIHRERDEIQKQILAEIDTTEIVFLEQALDMLKLKEEHMNTLNECKITEEKVDKVPIVYEKTEINLNKLDWFDVNEEGAACVEVIQNQIEELDIDVDEFVDSNLNPEAPSFEIDDVIPEELLPAKISPELSTDNAITDIDKLNQAKYFYFYQSDDGQQIFLNSLNVRILNASWGTLAAAPQIISGNVLHRESFSLHEQTRNHMPCTAHLPLYCAYDIVELDLKPPHVTRTALQSFTEELKRRARMRARLDRAEKRRERQQHYAMEGPPKPDLSSEVLFPPAPSYYPSVEPSLPTFETSPSTSSGSLSSGPSFAKMLSTRGTWTVRSKVIETPSPPNLEDEPSAPRALVLSDAVEAALNAPQASTRKKKKKQKVLFATGLQRAP